MSLGWVAFFYMAGNPRKLIKELEALQKSGNCIDSSLVEANGFIWVPQSEHARRPFERAPTWLTPPSAVPLAQP